MKKQKSGHHPFPNTILLANKKKSIKNQAQKVTPHKNEENQCPKPNKAIEHLIKQELHHIKNEFDNLFKKQEYFISLKKQTKAHQIKNIANTGLKMPCKQMETYHTPGKEHEHVSHKYKVNDKKEQKLLVSQRQRDKDKINYKEFQEKINRKLENLQTKIINKNKKQINKIIINNNVQNHPFFQGFFMETRVQKDPHQILYKQTKDERTSIQQKTHRLKEYNQILNEDQGNELQLKELKEKYRKQILERQGQINKRKVQNRSVQTQQIKNFQMISIEAQKQQENTRNIQLNYLIESNTKINQENIYIKQLNQGLFNQNSYYKNQLELLNNSNVNYQKYIEDLKKMSVQSENDYKKKIDYVKKQLKEYQKREDLFNNQIMKLNQQILRIQAQKDSLEQKIQDFRIDQQSNQIEAENGGQNNKEIQEVIIQLSYHKQLNKQISQRYSKEMKNIELIIDYKQKNHNNLIKDYQQLKNKEINSNNKLEQLQQQTNSLKQFIKIYLQKQKQEYNKHSKALQYILAQNQTLIATVNKLQEQINLLQQQRYKQDDQKQEKQNIQFKENYFKYSQLKVMVHQQLKEIQSLKLIYNNLDIQSEIMKNKIVLVEKINVNLKEEIQLLKLQEIPKEIESFDLQYQHLQKLNIQNTEKMFCLNTLIKKLIIQRCTKQDETQIQYHLNQFRIIFQKYQMNQNP